jgi:soluble lytic murein transglycosylase
MKWLSSTWLLLLSLCATPIAQATDNAELLKQRQTFQEAFSALKAKQYPRYQDLLASLGGYPLQPYLEYRYLRLKLGSISPQAIETFLQAEDNTFYAQRLRTAWLDLLARQKRWKTFLAFYQAPQSAELQCEQLQAYLATGNKQAAFESAPNLWLVPHSQHKACDIVFQQWQQAGGLTEELRKARFKLAIDAEQFSIAEYLAKTSQDADVLLAQVSRWKGMQNNPLSLFKQLPAPADANRFTLGNDTPETRAIIVYGFTRLARKDPDRAYQEWQRLKDHYAFSSGEVTTIRQVMGLWAALNRASTALTYFGEPSGHEWHARAALWQQDWSTLQKVIASMPDDLKQSHRWQYWLARSHEALGESASAQQIYQGIQADRDYYAFLASDRLQQPYTMKHRPLQFDAAELDAFKQRADIKRMYEFYIQDMQLEAKREYYFLSQTAPAEDLQKLAILTYQWGWHPQTIAILGKAQYWDAVNLRFPVLFLDDMQRAGLQQGLNFSWLMAIARQESAFNPSARSHAGARGLMQLMPATGRLTAKIIQQPLKHVNELYQPQTNITLGSAYLKQMLDDNQGNPVLATAAYNAGPHRVARWLPPQALDATIWAENIPFNETRHYVQNVMSYAAIFDHQRNESIKPLTERMPPVQPDKP